VSDEDGQRANAESQEADTKASIAAQRLVGPRGSTGDFCGADQS